MAERRTALSLDEELMILLLWAYSKDMARKMGAEKLQAVPGLKEAMDALAILPAAIGWDESDMAKGLDLNAREAY